MGVCTMKHCQPSWPNHMQRYQYPVTPAEIGRDLAWLLTELRTGTKPVYVPVRPVETGRINECLPTVDAYVAQHGGTRLLGWSLWEFPGLFVEAEFHAVWKSHEGDLVDVTPKRRATKAVLFLPAPEMTYSGSQVNNVRRPISLDPLVVEYLATFDDEFDLINRGERAKQHGEISLGGAEAQEYGEIERRRAATYFHVRDLASAIGPYTPCPCNSGKKVRWCHGVKSILCA
jgi:hypothetical protein